MATHKVAITIPAVLLKEVDRVAEGRGISRSRFITQELRERIKELSKQELEEKINRVFSDSEIVKEQQAVSERYLAIFPITEEESW